MTCNGILVSDGQFDLKRKEKWSSTLLGILIYCYWNEVNFLITNKRALWTSIIIQPISDTLPSVWELAKRSDYLLIDNEWYDNGRTKEDVQLMEIHLPKGLKGIRLESRKGKQ